MRIHFSNHFTITIQPKLLYTPLYSDDVDVDSKSIDIVYSPELIRLQQFTDHLIDSFFPRSMSLYLCFYVNFACQFNGSRQILTPMSMHFNALYMSALNCESQLFE